MSEDRLSERHKNCLKTVITHFENEDRFLRDRQLRNWKRLKFLWNGFQNIWWSETAHDWRVYDQQMQNETDQSYYDKPVNVFRAYLESIIAALSVTVPPIKCGPDNADNPLDIDTAKAGDKITGLVYKHNDAPLLWIHALFVFATEGLIAAYNYTDEDEKYGTYSEEKYEDEEIETEDKLCPICHQQLSDDSEKYEYDPGEDDVEIKNLMNEGLVLCKNCAQLVDPELRKNKFTVSRITGYTKQPKSRQCIEIYGGLNIKVAGYARKVCETPYLRYAYECHYADAIEEFPQLFDNKSRSFRIGPGEIKGIYDIYEAWARQNPQYFGEYPINNVTVRKYWLRHSAFNVLGNKDDIDALKKRFPDGAKVCLVNDEYVESENQSLDDHWTLAVNPLSDFLVYEPIGNLLVTIQDITNMLVSLVLQTIEHGVPQTFADPSVLNFNAYKNSEVLVGGIFPATPKAGKGLGDAFYEVKTATLSGEVMPFGQKIQELGQLVSGALPSLFGGVSTGGSQTASEYSMSRAQALQRLQNTWKMLNFWWKNIFSKVIPAYIKEMKEDEHYTVPGQNGNYITVAIRMAELQGKLGDIELEASEQLPLTWAQKKDVIEKLMQTNNPEILAALAAPENSGLIASALGLDNFVVPGEADRIKQFEEIEQLLASEPIPGMNGEQEPSVPVDPILDNHQIEAAITRTWLISDTGRQVKVDNPPGYLNVLLHYKAHMLAMMQAQQPQLAPAAPVEPSVNNAGAQNNGEQ